MKRYWKACSLIVITVLSISSFYIQSAYSASQLPEYVIKKQAGKPEAIDPVVLRGQYQNNDGTVGESLDISSGGSEYRSGKSFWSQIDNMYYDSEQTKKLHEKYRSFMRGKGGEEFFFQDKRNLVFAEMKYTIEERTSFTFDIAALDKKENNENSFEIGVPQGKKYSFVQLEDVQYSGGKVILVTKNFLNDLGGQGRETQELHVYTFDFSEKKLVSDEVILSESMAKGNFFVDFEKVPEVNKMGRGKYIVFKKVFSAQAETEARSSDNTLIVYNLIDKEKAEIKVSKEMQEVITGTGTYYEGSNLYYAVVKDDKAMVITYDLDNKKLKKEIAIPLGETEMLMKQAVIKNGRVYLLVSEKQAEKGDEYATVLVADLETGKPLYRGTIVNSNLEEKSEGILYLNELTIK